MKRQLFPITTNASGDATVYAEGASSPAQAVLGKLYAIEYRPGTIATGATVTVTCESGSSKPLLTKSSAGTSNSWYYPRDLVHAVLDGAALTGTSGGDRALPVLNGSIKVVIASGGNAASGSLIAYFEE
jgi:hypothetical protein